MLNKLSADMDALTASADKMHFKLYNTVQTRSLHEEPVNIESEESQKYKLSIVSFFFFVKSIWKNKLKFCLSHF